LVPSNSKLYSSSVLPFISRSSNIIKLDFIKDKLSAYGITEDTFFRIFSDLFNPIYKNLDMSPIPVFGADSMLPIFNGIRTQTSFSPGLGKADIEYMMYELFTDSDGIVDSEGLANLVWKDFQSGKFAIGQTMKDWIKLIYDKVIGYQGNDPTIKMFQKQFSSLPALDVVTSMRRKIYFSEDELTTGLVVYKAALALFGHGTVRFMFANMISLSKNARGIFISAPPLSMKDLASCFKHISFISPLARATTPTQIYGLSQDTGLRQFLGLFTGNAYSYLPVWDFVHNNRIQNTDNNRFIFPVGPTIYTDRVAEGTDMRRFNRAIFSQAIAKFRAFEASYRVPTRRFIESQSNLYDIISNKIITKYIQGNYLGDIAKSTRFAHTLLAATYRGLSSYSGESLRKQFESQIISGILHKLVYYGIKNPLTGRDVVIPISFSDVMGKDIFIWGQKHASEGAGWDFDSYSRSIDEIRAPQVKESSDQIVKELKKTGKTKFRIVHLYNSQQDNLGYQYLVETTIVTKRDIHSRDYIKDFVIDLDNKQDTKDKLAYLLDIVFTSSRDGNDYLSVILDFDTTVNVDIAKRVVSVDNAVAILSPHGFVPIDHLDSEAPQQHSDKIRYDTSGYHNYAFKISKSQGAIAVSSLNLKWDQIWKVYCYYSYSSYLTRLNAHISRLRISIEDFLIFK